MKYPKLSKYLLSQPVTRSSGTPKDEWLTLEKDSRLAFEFEGLKFSFYANKGAKFDGASIPRWAWSLIGITPFGLVKMAALVHDILYVAAGDVNSEKMRVLGFSFFVHRADSNKPAKVTRKMADQIFAVLLLHTGYSKRQSTLAYSALRVGAKSHWGGKKK